MSVNNLESVLGNIRALADSLGKGADEGLKRAALFVKADSQKRCPVDTGTLRASADVGSVGTEKYPAYKVGYYTDYAIFVHERVEASHTVGEAKFLENALIQNEKIILDIVARYSKGGIK